MTKEKIEASSAQAGATSGFSWVSNPLPHLEEVVACDLPKNFHWQCEGCGYSLALNSIDEMPSRCPMCGYSYVH